MEQRILVGTPLQMIAWNHGAPCMQGLMPQSQWQCLTELLLMYDHFHLSNNGTQLSATLPFHTVHRSRMLLMWPRPGYPVLLY